MAQPLGTCAPQAAEVRGYVAKRAQIRRSRPEGIESFDPKPLTQEVVDKNKGLGLESRSILGRVEACLRPWTPP